MDRDVRVMANKGQSRGEQEGRNKLDGREKKERRSTRPLRGRDEPALSTAVEYEDYYEEVILFLCPVFPHLVTFLNNTTY